MSEIQRYSLIGEVEEIGDGEFVSFADYLALQSKLPSWVNADARKPDESTHVLATFKNGDYEIVWFEAGDWWGTDRGDEPTHWMPLPEQPKS